MALIWFVLAAPQGFEPRYADPEFVNSDRQDGNNLQHHQLLT